MKTILFPTEGIEAFFIRAELPSGSPTALTEERMQALERVIQKHIPRAYLRGFVTYVGLQQQDSLDPFKVAASHKAQIGVYLTPELEREETADEIIDKLRPKVADAAEQAGLSQISFLRKRVGPPVGKPVAIRVAGFELADLRAATERIAEHLGQFDGVKDISSSFQEGKEELRVEVKGSAASRALLSSQQIALHVRAMLEGQIATHINRDGERIPLRVRYKEADRRSIASIKDSLLANARGYMVPLRSVASFSTAEGLRVIQHRDGERFLSVTAALDEEVASSSEVNRAIEPFLAEMRSAYPNLSFHSGGEYEDTSNSMQSLRNAFAFALLMIFFILATQFGSLTQPFVVMAAIPFGAIGVIAAFYFHGLPLSFLGMIGMIGLTGVVVNDSIVLVDFINKARGRGMPARKAALYAGKRRFRAVWLTSITTVLGLMPLVYGIGGHDAFLRPAAMALGYGLLFATVLILLLVPALYLIREDLAGLGRRVLGRPAAS